MSFTPVPALVPDRDKLPLKKRDQRPGSPSQHEHHQHHQCDAATFKAPYPYRSPSESKTKHTGPFQPVPRRVPALHQPWTQTHPSAGSRPHDLSAFRDHHHHHRGGGGGGGGWAEWRPLNPPLHPGWAIPASYQHHGHLSGTTALLHPGRPHIPSRFVPVSLVAEGVVQRARGGRGWERLKASRDDGSDPERPSDGGNKWPYVRRRDRRAEHFASPPSPPREDLALHREAAAVERPAPGRSSVRVPSVFPSSERASSSSSSSSSSSNRFPWLLPHFVAGSLIELRDGRLRRVEHLQTEDFLLGSLACPDLRLSCCTVQSITPSAPSSSSSSSSSSCPVSRLLILLHDQQSQELVDVYVEYPFFVRGSGWSSCRPQRTARLCGLRCRQLSVGDVCLALTPVSASRPPSPATREPPEKNSPRGFESPKASPAGGAKKGAGPAARRRHCSAPELRGPGTRCVS